jgi:hypothetical protein
MLNQIKNNTRCSFVSFCKTKYFNVDENQWINADAIKVKKDGKGFEIILPKKIQELTEEDLKVIENKIYEL